MAVVGNSYLSIGGSNMYYWSMSPANFYYGYAGVWIEYEFLGDNYVSNYRGVRPVISLLTENGFTSGDGTASDPYILS